jgi:adenylate cyclase
LLSEFLLGKMIESNRFVFISTEGTSLIGAVPKMAIDALGTLVPIGGGDPIPLIRSHLTVGRRESCDVCLRYPNVSGIHCELALKDGFWTIRDLNSTNGIKVNGKRCLYHVLAPGDVVRIAKRDFTIEYSLSAEKRSALEQLAEENVMSESLLQRAGLEKRPAEPKIEPPRRKSAPSWVDDEDDDDDDD